MKIRNGASERLLEKGLEEREIGKRARRRSEMGLEKLALIKRLEKLALMKGLEKLALIKG